MCGSMADIQSAAAEIRRGKKERKNKSQHENIMVCPIPFHSKQHLDRFTIFTQFAAESPYTVQCELKRD